MKKTVRYVVEAIIVFVLTFVLTITNLFSGLDYMLKDLLYQMPRGVDNDIKIIAIDERTLEELGPINTWSRQYYADLINYFNQDENAKPSVIAFDVLFSGYFGENGEPSEGDIAFARAVKESENVVVVSQFQYEEKPTYYKDGTTGYDIKAVYYPYEELREVANIGYSNVAQDSDGIVRRIILSEEYDGQTTQTFSKEIYDLYCANQGIAPNKVVTDKYNKTMKLFRQAGGL